MIYNDNNSTSKVFYSGFTITKVYACGGELVWAASPYAFKAMYTLNDSTTGKVSCNSDSTLRYTDFGDQVSNVMYLTVGECVDNFETHLVSLMYSSLRTIDLTNSSITSLPSNFLNGVSTLREATLNPNTTTIGGGAFGGCTSLSDITIPSSVTSIELGAFRNSGLRDVTIYSGITYGNQVYSMCSSLSSVTIEEGTRSIPNGTFALSSGITEVTIPSSVTYVGSQAFIGCYGLSEVTCLPTTPPNLGEENVFPSSCIIYVPCEAMSAYTAHTDWQPYLDKLRPIEDNCETIIYRWQPSGTTCIDVDKYQNNIKQISYNSGATWSNVSPSEYSASTLIERNSTDCGYIEPQYRTISTAVTCSGVDKYKVDEHQESLDGGVTWTTTSTTIGDLIQANSYDCGYRTRTTSGTPYCVDVDKYQDVYSEYSTDSGTTWITASTTPTLIEADSEDCGYVPPTPTALKFKLTHNDNSISSAACDSTSAITSSDVTNSLVSPQQKSTAIAIEIGDCVTEISNNAFGSMRNVSALTFGNNIVTIGESAFYLNDYITDIVIPNSVTTIGESAFQHMESLSSVTISDNVTSIGQAAFEQSGYNNPNLRHIEVGSGVTYIGAGAFTVDNTNSETHINRFITEVVMHCTTPPTFASGNNPFQSMGKYNVYIPNALWDDYMATSQWSGLKRYTNIHLYTIDPEYRTISTATTCVGVDKYAVDEYQMTQNRWETYQTISSTTGNLIEANSYDCGYRTRTLNTATTCVGVDKYTLEEYQVSTDSGTTWTTTGTSATTLLEANSYDCGYRTRTTSSATYCEGYDKMIDVYSEVSTDSGTTWTTASTTPTLIEPNSSDCGYSAHFKAKRINRAGYTFQVDCNESTTLTRTEVLDLGGGFVANMGDWYSAEIGDCVTEIGEGAFNGAGNLSALTINNGVVTISKQAFYSNSSLSSVTIPSSVLSIGQNAFNNCRQLKSITVMATTPPTLYDAYSFTYTLSGLIIYVPAESLELYKTTNIWNLYANNLQAIGT